MAMNANCLNEKIKRIEETLLETHEVSLWKHCTNETIVYRFKCLDGKHVIRERKEYFRDKQMTEYRKGKLRSIDIPVEIFINHTVMYLLKRGYDLITNED